MNDYFKIVILLLITQAILAEGMILPIKAVFALFKPCLSFQNVSNSAMEPYIKHAMQSGLLVTIGNPTDCPNKGLHISDIPVIIPYIWDKILIVFEPGNNIPNGKKFGNREVIMLNNETILQLSSKSNKTRIFKPFSILNKGLMLKKLAPINLNGQICKVAMFHCPVMCMIINDHGNVKYDGLEIRILNEIAHKLNFTWKPQPIKGKSMWGTLLSNGTWIGGVVGALANNKADIGLCSPLIASKQVDIIDISVNYAKIQISFLVPKVSEEHRQRIMFLPFKVEIFLLILAVLIITIIIYYYSAMFFSKPLSIGDAALKIIGFVLICYSSTNRKENTTQLIIKNVISILTIIITSIYSSFVISRLTHPPCNQEIDTVKDLVENGFMWGRHMEGVDPELIFNTRNDWHNEFAKRYVYVSNLLHLSNLVQKKNFAIYVEYMERRYINMDFFMDGVLYNKLRLMNEVTKEHIVGLGFTKHSSITLHANRIIDRLKSGGLITKMHGDILRLYGVKEILTMLRKKDLNTNKHVKPLKLKNLSGAFCWWCFGLIISSLLFFIELLYNYFCQRKLQ